MNQFDTTDAIRPEITLADTEMLGSLLRSVLRPGMTAVEVGSLAGNGSTRLLCEGVRPTGGALYAVDTWEGSDNVPHHLRYRSEYGSLFPVFAGNVFRYRGQSVIRPLRMPSLEAAALFPDGSLDFVFIDGHHGYSYVVADIRAWLPKMRPGGLLCGHDCDGRYGTFDEAFRAEVDRCCEEDTVANIGVSWSPVVHGGVVKAVHEEFGGRATLWFERCHSTVWSYRTPGGMGRRLRDWIGGTAPGPRPEPTPWP